MDSDPVCRPSARELVENPLFDRIQRTKKNQVSPYYTWTNWQDKEAAVCQASSELVIAGKKDYCWCSNLDVLFLFLNVLNQSYTTTTTTIYYYF